MDARLRLRLATAAAVPALLLSLAACGDGSGRAVLGDDPGDPGDPGDPVTISHADGAQDVVLRIDSGGGFVPVSWAMGDVAEVTITGDGTVYVAQPTSGEPIRPIRTGQLDEAQVQRVLAWAQEAGLLDASGELDLPPDQMVTDAPTTTVLLDAGGAGPVEHSAYALGFEKDPDGPRRRLAAFVDDVTTLADGSAGAAYEPSALVVNVLAPFRDGPGHERSPDAADDGEGMAGGATLHEGCQVVDDPAHVAALLADQPDVAAGHDATVVVRALLPGDPGCAGTADDAS